MCCQTLCSSCVSVFFFCATSWTRAKKCAIIIFDYIFTFFNAVGVVDVARILMGLLWIFHFVFFWCVYFYLFCNFSVLCVYVCCMSFVFMLYSFCVCSVFPGWT